MGGNKNLTKAQQSTSGLENCETAECRAKEEKLQTTRHIEVNLKNNTLTAYPKGNQHPYDIRCSIIGGTTNNPTTPGHQKILRKGNAQGGTEYTSKAYGARMDYPLWYNNKGEAIHKYHGPLFGAQSDLQRVAPGLIGSHGCVRLTEEYAKQLWDWSKIGDPVVIRDGEKIPIVKTVNEPAKPKAHGYPQRGFPPPNPNRSTGGRKATDKK